MAIWICERNLPSWFKSVGLQVCSGNSQGPQESVKVSSRPNLFSQKCLFIFLFFHSIVKIDLPRGYKAYDNNSQNAKAGTPLVVQGLGLSPHTAKGLGSIPGQVTKITQAMCCSKKKKKSKSRYENPSISTNTGIKEIYKNIKHCH